MSAREEPRDVLEEVARGTAPPGIALMRLVLAEDSAFQVSERIEAACASCGDPAARARLTELQALWAANPLAWQHVRSAAAAVTHDASLPSGEALADIARQFDAAARASPEAGVTLYSLGNPLLLENATREIAGWLRRRSLLGKARDVLDIGCGIGRLEAAISGEVRSVTGIDVSARMVAVARERCRAFANVRIELAAGTDLAGFADASFDLVLAVDVFPYLDIAGVADAHLRDCARVLRPGGDVVIMNYSYRLEEGAVAAELRARTQGHGLTLSRGGARPFRSWDGAVYQLRLSGSRP